ncbi:MAG: hypothetical protein H8E54_03215 [Candidatus Aminicenantes bacterium]|nr:hypothetical protein [Candidatus Aminicenantes bacterium]
MNKKNQSEIVKHYKEFSRRDFVKYLLAGSALSASTLSKLNASVYQSIMSLSPLFGQKTALFKVH